MGRIADYPPLIIGQRLNEAMRERGITASALARRMGRDRKTIYSYQNGDTTPTLGDLYRLEQILIKPKGWLQGLKEESK